jgi:small-conductance mechanosensitive channel
MITTSLLLFGLNVINDILAVRFVQAVQKRHRLKASLISMGIVALAYVSTIFVVSDFLFIIPAALGAGVGCFITIKK